MKKTLKQIEKEFDEKFGSTVYTGGYMPDKIKSFYAKQIKEMVEKLEDRHKREVNYWKQK